ncbi:MAG: antibiotic biosynthesis monooxygenase [Ilumatobacteraceae bacterium]
MGRGARRSPDPAGRRAVAASPSLTGAIDTARLPRIAADPVTVTVARRVLPGWEAEFFRWADELLAAVREFPGCLGAAVFSPGDAGGEYQIVVRFANGVLLRDWERSEIRNRLMDRGDEFVTEVRLQRTVGVDAWFEAAAHAPTPRPWWKQLLIDVAWLYPVSIVMAIWVAPAFADLHVAVRVAVTGVIIVFVLQVFVTPLRARLRARRRL